MAKNKKYYPVKTILITSFHPIISRNIFSTEIPHLLKKRGYRVCVAVPAFKKDFFEKEYSSIGIEVFPVDILETKRENILRYMALSAIKSCTLTIKRRAEMNGRGVIFSLFFANILGVSILRWLENVTYKKSTFKYMLQEIKPDLVFATDLQNSGDIRLMNESKKLRILTVGMVRSWDNLSSKGAIRVLPDRLIVTNSIIAEEAQKKHFVPKGIIRIVGIPHYDAYKNCSKITKKEFFESMSIRQSLDHKTVLYVPTGDRYIKDNNVDCDIVDLLDRNLPKEVIVLVRLPIGDSVRGISENSNGFSDRVYIMLPTQKFAHIKMSELSPLNEKILSNTLYWSDVVVSGPSTMIIDANFFDKPVVVTAFDGYKKRIYLESIRRFFDYDYLKKALSYGGISYASSPEDLCREVGDYILNPKKNASGRNRLAWAEAEFLDGESCERLVDALLENE